MEGPVEAAMAAVESTEEGLRASLADQLRTAIETDTLSDRARRAFDTDDGEAIRRAAAQQATVLTNRVRYRVAVGDLPPDLRQTPVLPFRPLDDPPDIDEPLAELADTLPGAAEGLIGAGYVATLTDEERRTRGQFYTPGPVAAAVAGWALEAGDGPPRVLDPAAGTGTFPLAAFDVIRERHSALGATEVFDRLVAVDVDRVALHLAGLRLSARADGKPVSGFDRRPRSFFALDPADLPAVDAVVGNPPFVRTRDLDPGPEHYRDHLAALGPAGRTPYLDGDRAISGRSDASVYFVTQATRFLSPGGRLGLVLPAKWLESEYGVGFRRFLADHYRVNAVVGFDARAFDALVDTVLLFAERRARDPAGIDEGPVKFIRLPDGSVTRRTISRLVDDGLDQGPEPGKAGRVIERSPSTFAEARQCSPYLRAPEALLALLDHPAFVPLGELADVARGVTTGANRFFLLDRSDRDRWGIDEQFLRPALRSLRGFGSRTFSATDVDRWMLDAHGFLSGRLPGDSTDGGDAAAVAALRAADHDGLADYIAHGEREGCHEGRTCRARQVWFDLGPLPTPDGFVPKLLRERVFTVRNRAGAVPTNAIDCLAVNGGVDPALLLAVLDSSLCRAIMEVWGRNEAGMLQLMTAETRTLPVPDIRGFSPAEAAAIKTAAAALDPGGSDDDAQRDLDRAVHDAAPIDLGPGRMRELRNRLLRRRVDGGERVDVPVAGG